MVHYAVIIKWGSEGCIRIYALGLKVPLSSRHQVLVKYLDKAIPVPPHVLMGGT